MDAEHRHELKINELADWLGHLPRFLHDNTKTIIGVVLIIAAVAVYFYGTNMRTDAALAEKAEATQIIQGLVNDKMVVLGGLQESNEPSDAMMIAANRLGMAVDNIDSPYVAAMLLIKQGQALRTDLHYRPEEVDAALIQERVAKATEAYEKALTKAEGNATLTAMATFGLGLCAEEGGDFDKAKELYASIIDNADFAGTVFPKQARQRIDGMADNSMKFVFVKAPAPEPKPAAPGFKMPPAIEMVTPKPDEKETKPVEEVIIEPKVQPEKDTEAEPAKEPETVEIGTTEESETK